MQSSSQDIRPEPAAALTGSTDVVGQQSKRDSRQSSSPSSSFSFSSPYHPNTLWPVAASSGRYFDRSLSSLSGRGKKGRIDKILAKEDFLPNRGKKLLLDRINYLRNQRDQEALFFPKRGKKTRHYPKNLNSRPTDLMWLIKDEFFPHRGKKLDNSVLDYYYYDDDGEDYGPEEDSLGNVLLDGVINDDGGGSRDSISIGRQNRELLSNLSKQEPRDKWRGRKRSVQLRSVDGGRSSNIGVAALNEVIDRR